MRDVTKYMSPLTSGERFASRFFLGDVGVTSSAASAMELVREINASDSVTPAMSACVKLTLSICGDTKNEKPERQSRSR